MKFTSESKFLIGVLLATVAIIGFAVVIFTRPENVTSVEITLPESAHIIGNTSATTTLVEFSDFQCPACAAFEPAVQQIVNTYSDQMRFVYIHFPLPNHAMAEPAARAAEAAGLQGKFWEMHHLLFANQSTLSEETFTQLAQSLKLDMTQFQSDYKGTIVKDIVEQNRQEGVRLGIPGTPTFYLNGIKLTLYGPQDLESAIQNAIKK